MKANLWMLLILVLISGIVPFPIKGTASDFQVYSVYTAVNLGNPGEPLPAKDYYINMGSIHGLHDGSTVAVFRRIATYDLISQKLSQEMLIPIAKLKVIHVEKTTAIARLDKFLPPEKAPATNPRAVIIGDLVKISE